MSFADLSSVALNVKVQSGLGAPASGAGARQIEVLPSQGMALQIATIESQMIRRSRMRKRPRHGTHNITASYETELSTRAMDPIYEAVLGGAFTAQAQKAAPGDLGSLTIAGTGTTVTRASGSFITDGVAAGHMIMLGNMSTSANNGIWVPVLGVTALVLTVAPGYLTDQAADAACTIDYARHLYTPTPYVGTYWTAEENSGDVDASKLGSDLRWNQLNISVDPNQFVRVGFGAGGRKMESKTVGDAPVFSSPTLYQNDSLILIDGGVFVNGAKRVDLTQLQFGLAAPVTGLPVIGSKESPDVYLGQFAFTGQVTGAVEDHTELAAVLAESDVSIMLHCKEKSTQEFVSFYIGYLSYAGYSSPAGGEGALIQTIPLYGGADTRGAGYHPTTMVIATSAAA